MPDNSQHLVLLAGVSGRLGRHVAQILRQQDYRIRALTYDVSRIEDTGADCDEYLAADLTRPETLDGLCKDVNTVISCAGASLDVRKLSDRNTYYEVDFHGNNNLLECALASGVKKFIYISVFGAPKQRHLEYSDAHERFAENLQESGIDYTIIRPTGFFSIFNDMFDMARKGRGIVIGDGSAKTNPIHEADLAEACVAAILNGKPEQDIGGPQVLTRRQIVELAFEVVGKQPKISSVPPWVFKGATAALQLVNPRIAALLAFGAEVSVSETVAPAHGKRRLVDYYRTLAGSPDV